MMSGNGINKIPTGIPGLDYMLRGGIPEGSTVLLYGGPGSGKTILAIQYLCNGANNGGAALYVSADEPKHRIYLRHESMGFRLSEYEKIGKFIFLDATPIRLIGDDDVAKGSPSRILVSSLLARIKELVSRFGVKRIVIDPLSILSLRVEKPYEKRNMLYELFRGLSEIGATSLVISEMRESPVRRTIEVEEYLSDGVISLRNVYSRDTVIRVIQVEKMRGTEIDIQPRPYTITSRGIVVYSDEAVLV